MKKFILNILIFVGLQFTLFVLAVSKLSKENATYFSGAHAHFVAFFVTALVLVVLLKHDFVKFKYAYSAAFLYVVVAAVAIEVVQYFIPYRHYDIIDMLWSISGGLAFIVLGKVLNYVKGMPDMF